MRNADSTVAFRRELVIGSDAAETNVNGFRNGPRRIGKHDQTMLHRQVNHFAKEMYDQRLFDEIQAYADSSESEKLTSEVIESIPERSELVRVGDGHTRVDFGAAAIRQTPNGAFTVIAPYGQGAHPTDIMDRFPPSYYGIETFETGRDDSPEAIAEGTRLKRINEWVKNNSNDLALLEIMYPQGQPADGSGANLRLRQPVPPAVGLDGQGHPTVFAPPVVDQTTSNFSPFCVGVHPRPQTGLDNFIIYAPDAPVTSNASLGFAATNPQNAASQPIDVTSAILGLNTQITNSSAALIGVNYDQLTRSYEIAKKELYELAITSTRNTRLYGRDGDYLSSSTVSQVDLMFPKKILITSNDLLQQPERSQDAASREPILSSYTLPTILPVSVKADAQPSGSSSSPFGSVFFSETGTRRYHSLIKIPGGLRSFRIHALLSYKDSSKTAKEILLPPGGLFSCQLLFTKKMEE